MSAQKDAVEHYFDGFRRNDHQAILECLTEDVVWDLPGYRHLVGKAAFDGEIDGPEFVESPILEIDRLIEEDAVVVAIGEGRAMRVTGDFHRFGYCDVFTFEEDKIARVESYLVPLSEEE